MEIAPIEPFLLRLDGLATIKKIKSDFLYGLFFLFPRHFFEIKVLVSLQSNRRRCVMNVYVTAISLRGSYTTRLCSCTYVVETCGVMVRTSD